MLKLCSAVEQRLWRKSGYNNVFHCKDHQSSVLSPDKPVVSVRSSQVPARRCRSVVASRASSGETEDSPAVWAGVLSGERERGHNQSVRSLLLPPPSVELEPVQTRPPAFYDLTVYCCLGELLLNFTPVCFSKTWKRFSKVYPREQLLESFEVIRQVIRGR